MGRKNKKKGNVHKDKYAGMPTASKTPESGVDSKCQNTFFVGRPVIGSESLVATLIEQFPTSEVIESSGILVFNHFSRRLFSDVGDGGLSLSRDITDKINTFAHSRLEIKKRLRIDRKIRQRDGGQYRNVGSIRLGNGLLFDEQAAASLSLPARLQRHNPPKSLRIIETNSEEEYRAAESVIRSHFSGVIELGKVSVHSVPNKQ